MTCKELVEALEAYVAGELEANRKSGLEDHARGCRACRLYVDSYRATIHLSRRSAQRDAKAKTTEISQRLVRRIVEARRRRGE